MTQRATYRHGNVRDEAIAHALAALESGQALSLRAVAKEVGVAHHALSHHFDDLQGLLRAVAAAGFTQLCDALADAKTPEAYMRAFLAFGLKRPALYDLMMRQSVDAGSRSAALQLARDRLIALSVAMFAPDAKTEDAARRRVMRIWMMLHGGLALHGNRVLQPRTDDAFIAEMLQIVSADRG